MITDVQVSFMNEPQDMHTFCDNACRVQYDNGTYINLLQSDSAFTYQWYAVLDTTMVPIATTFHLNLMQVKDLIGGNGEKVFVLRVTHTETGRMWQNYLPTIVNLSDWQEEGYTTYPMPAPSQMTFQTWVIAAGGIAQFAPHRHGAHFIGGKSGDINGDGIVNISDLLLLSSTFGQ